MKTTFHWLARILFLFLMTLSINNMMTLELFELEEFECEEECVEEIEIEEEARSHWKPKTGKRSTPFQLWLGLTSRAVDEWIVDPDTDEDSTIVTSIFDPQPFLPDGVYLFYGDVSPPVCV